MTPSHTPAEVTQEARRRELNRAIFDENEVYWSMEYGRDIPSDVLDRILARLSAQPSLPDGVGEIVERLRQDARDMSAGGFPIYARPLNAAADTIVALQAENFRLAAGQCTVENGLIGDEHGHFGCALQARVAALEGGLRVVERVLVEGQPAICCTVWVPGECPETLLDHIRALLADAKAGDAGGGA